MTCVETALKCGLRCGCADHAELASTGAIVAKRELVMVIAPPGYRHPFRIPEGYRALISCGFLFISNLRPAIFAARELCDASTFPAMGPIFAAARCLFSRPQVANTARFAPLHIVSDRRAARDCGRRRACAMLARRKSAPFAYRQRTPPTEQPKEHATETGPVVYPARRRHEHTVARPFPVGHRQSRS